MLDKNFTKPMLYTFLGAVLALLLYVAVVLLALRWGAGVTVAGMGLLAGLVSLIGAFLWAMVGAFLAMIQKETGIPLQTVPPGSSSTTVTNLNSEQKIETPAAPVPSATAPVPVVAVIEPKVVPA